MVYPVFDEESLIQRCKDDINKFYSDKINSILKTNDIVSIDNKNEIKKIIENYHDNKNEITKIIENYDDNKRNFSLIEQKYSEINKIDNVFNIKAHMDKILKFIHKKEEKNYLKIINSMTNEYKLDEELLNELWIARTYLLFFILICVTKAFKNKELFDSIYSKNYPNYKFKSFGNIDPSIELKKYKIGIFGSMNATSDIDIGISYFGIDSDPKLAYIIEGIENIFLILTGNSSLDFDIECYAGMITLEDNEKEYFYLDTSEFTINEFNKILPYALKGIARNVLLSNKYSTAIRTDSNLPPNISDILNIVTNIKLPDYKQKEGIINDLEIKTQSNTEIINNVDISKYEVLFTNAFDEMNIFLRLNYDEQRKEYYKRVLEAEKTKLKYTKLFNQNNTEFSIDQICEIIEKLADCDCYRMESYTCAPTVVFVVRILQNSKNQINKYKTTIPSDYCSEKGMQKLEDPYCSIGKYGYMLSALEQVGYMYRFYYDYCDIIIDKSKCDKKIEKYRKRYDESLFFFHKYPIIPTGRGGRKTRKIHIYKRKSHSMKKCIKKRKNKSKRKNRYKL